MPYLSLDKNTYSPAHAFFYSEIRVDTVTNFLATLPARSLGPGPKFRFADQAKHFLPELVCVLPSLKLPRRKKLSSELTEFPHSMSVGSAVPIFYLSFISKSIHPISHLY
jgi:hypothetical protein